MDLKSGRKEIDKIDRALIRLMKKRFDVARRLAPVKISITDRAREKIVLDRSKELRSVFKVIIKETKKRLQ